MRASFYFSATEIERFVRELLPLELDLSNEEAGRRLISVKKVDEVRLVPKEGIRVTGSVDVEWTLLGIRVPLSIDDVSLMIHVDMTHQALTVRFEIERADARLVPGIVEMPIIDKVNESLAAEGVMLRWAYLDSLKGRFDMPRMLKPLREVVLQSAGAELAVFEDEVVLAINAGANLHDKFEALPIMAHASMP